MKKHYVYRFKRCDEIIYVLYVGETKDMDKRMEDHFIGKGDNVSAQCYNIVTRIEYQEFDNSVDAKMFELYYMNIIKPQFNIKDKTDDYPTPKPEYDALFDNWKLYEEGDIKSIILEKRQKKRADIQSLIQEFEQTNRRLTLLTTELELTHKKMKHLIDSLGESFKENHIYGYPLNGAKYITEKGQLIIKDILKVA